MSELADSFLTAQPLMDGTDAVADQDAHANLSAGRMLRRAREAAGLHIAALAVSLKVPVKKLEALESDQFDLLPDAVFVRALASSVCRTLKIDAKPVLERLPQTGRPKLMRQGVGINTPFRAPGDGPGPSIWSHISRPAVMGGIVLLLGALVLLFLPVLKVRVEEVLSAIQNHEKPPAAVVTPQAGTADVAKPDGYSADSSVSAVTQTSGISSNPVPDRAPSVAAAPAGVAVSMLSAAVVSDSVPLPVLNPAVTANSMAALPTAGIVVFTAKGESWVEVTDAKGQVVLRRILGAGEVVSASGVLPLTAVVGRADATQVQVRGKAFDLSGFSKDNVARFEVK